MVQRGYKSWCEKAAEQYRQGLGVANHAPLCAWKLALHLGVIVCTSNDFPGLPKKTLDILHQSKSEWSAATLVYDQKNLIILNGSHAKARQSHDLMHELAHLIRGHAPARVDVTEDSLLMLHSYDELQEEEADLLAGVLLLPRVALTEIRRSKVPNSVVTDNYCVSQKLLTMRLNTSGVNKQFSNYRSFN